jgi:hypothetical protein
MGYLSFKNYDVFLYLRILTHLFKHFLPSLLVRVDCVSCKGTVLGVALIFFQDLISFLPEVSSVEVRNEENSCLFLLDKNVKKRV